MYQVISIGSALVDIFIHSQQFKTTQLEGVSQMYFKSGEKLEMDSLKVVSGGGASNTAVAFARLGFKTGVICETGQDHFGCMVLREFMQEEVETSLVVREKLEQTGGSVILVDSQGERTVMVHRGASSMLDPYDIPTYWTSQAQWIHLSSIAGRQATLEKIFMLVDKNQLNLSWNPGKAELTLLAEGKIKAKNIPCRLFFVNKEEWEMIGAIHHEILEHFSQIIVTNSNKGGEIFIGKTKHIQYQASSIKTVDNTGAGDAFAATYSAATLLGNSPEDALAWAKTNAASVVSFYGAKPGLLRRSQLEYQLKSEI